MHVSGIERTKQRLVCIFIFYLPARRRGRCIPACCRRHRSQPHHSILFQVLLCTPYLLAGAECALHRVAGDVVLELRPHEGRALARLHVQEFCSQVYHVWPKDREAGSGCAFAGAAAAADGR